MAHLSKYVHLDLKGAAPRILYLKEIFPLFSKWGATGLLIEYEDMFPYHGELTELQKPSAYTVDQVSEILSLAEKNNLSVIPLIQTFGHLEFVLKHDKFRHLREVDLYPNALCPEHPNSSELVLSLISQVMTLHPNVKHLHIGADEVWHMGKCERCSKKKKLKKWDHVELYLDWVSRVARMIKESYPDLDLIIWDDMMRTCSSKILEEFDMGKLVEPMIWKYDAKTFEFPIGMLDNFSKVFDCIWVASAFKGATGSTQSIPPIQHHINNHLTWVSTLKELRLKFKEVKGIALTGWQRYDHYAVLCELLPVAVPSLALCLRVLSQGMFTEEEHESVSKDLGFQTKINIHHFPRPQILEQGMTFPGHDMYTAVQMWSNFVCKYETICNSEGMLGWFSEYFRSKNFTNPAQVENLLYPMLELHDRITELQKYFTNCLQDIYCEDTVEEWIGSYFTPLIKRIETIINDCKEQIRLGMRNPDLEFDVYLTNNARNG